MTGVDVDALDAARAAATGGPWEASSPRADGGCYIDSTRVRLTDGSAPWIGRAHRERDAAVIVAAVNALPDLLAAVRERDALREAVEAVAQSLLDDRYDSGTDNGDGYSDGLTEGAERIRDAIATVEAS